MEQEDHNAIARIRELLEAKEFDQARDVIQGRLDYYAERWEDDGTELPSKIEEAFLAIELAAGGVPVPTRTP